MENRVWFTRDQIVKFLGDLRVLNAKTLLVIRYYENLVKYWPKDAVKVSLDFEPGAIDLSKIMKDDLGV